MINDKLENLIKVYRSQEERLRYVGNLFIDDEATASFIKDANIYASVILALEKILNACNDPQDNSP